jgi:hypothetical protein
LPASPHTSVALNKTKHRCTTVHNTAEYTRRPRRVHLAATQVNRPAYSDTHIFVFKPNLLNCIFIKACSAHSPLPLPKLLSPKNKPFLGTPLYYPVWNRPRVTSGARVKVNTYLQSTTPIPTSEKHPGQSWGHQSSLRSSPNEPSLPW